MTRVVVFGAAGFLGLNLVERLQTAGHEVVAIDRSTPSWRAERVEWRQADFLDPQSWRHLIQPGDVLYHLVSTTLPKSSNENILFDVQSNLCGTLGLLDACIARDVRKVVFLSSGGTVYGPPVQLPVPETHATSPLSSYGITKLAIEKYLSLYHHLHGLDYQVLRLSNPYGRHQNPKSSQGVVSVFLNLALSGKPIEVWGDGSVVRDYIYVSDVAAAMVTALDYGGPNRVLNLGSGQGLSLRDIIDKMSNLLGAPIEVSYSEPRSLDVSRNILDISAIKSSFGWEPTVSFEDGLRLTRDYLLDFRRS